jgi:hypothetical protein
LLFQEIFSESLWSTSIWPRKKNNKKQTKQQQQQTKQTNKQGAHVSWHTSQKLPTFLFYLKKKSSMP